MKIYTLIKPRKGGIPVKILLTGIPIKNYWYLQSSIKTYSQQIT